MSRVRTANIARRPCSYSNHVRPTAPKNCRFIIIIIIIIYHHRTFRNCTWACFCFPFVELLVLNLEMKTAFIFTQKFDILTTYKFHYTTARILNTVQFCTCGVDPHTTSPAKVGLTKQFRWSVSLHVRCSGATARPLQRRRYFIIMPECMAYEEIFRLCVSCMKYEVCYMKLDIGVPRILQWRVFTRVDQEISKKGLSQGAWGKSPSGVQG